MSASGSRSPENEKNDVIQTEGSSIPCSCRHGQTVTLCRVHLSIGISGEGYIVLYAGQDPDAPGPHVSAAAAAQAQQELLAASLRRPEGILQGLHRGAVTSPWQEHDLTGTCHHATPDQATILSKAWASYMRCPPVKQPSCHRQNCFCAMHIKASSSHRTLCILHHLDLT